MSLDKAIIERSTLYIIILSCFTLLLFVTNGLLRQILVAIQISLIILPVFYLFTKTKSIKFGLLAAGYAVFFGAVFVIVFRNLRDSLPFPEIHANKIVGYSQYFGYPIFMDTAIFLLFFSLPLAIFFFIGRSKKKLIK